MAVAVAGPAGRAKRHETEGTHADMTRRTRTIALVRIDAVALDRDGQVLSVRLVRDRKSGDRWTERAGRLTAEG